jgi:hypothetical protein
MKRLVTLIGLILCISSLAFSQQGGRVYGFFGPGQTRVPDMNKAYMSFGGGGMYLRSKGFGGGAEIAAVGPMKHTSDQDNFGKQSVALFTLNGVKGFKLNSDRVEPFASSGYGRTFMRSSGANWFELGGGVNLWFKEKLGTTVELRDYIHRQDKNEWWQFWSVRVGLVWRDRR